MTSEAYHKSSPSIHRPHVARFPRKTWCPGDPVPLKGTLEPDPHEALRRHCPGCGSRDRLNRALAVELDRVLAENCVLREELERAA